MPRIERAQRQARSFNAIPHPCDVCGRTPAIRHHQDYDNTTSVDWLCHYHHHLAHGRADPERTSKISAALFLVGEGYTKAAAARLLDTNPLTMRAWLLHLERDMVT